MVARMGIEVHSNASGAAADLDLLVVSSDKVDRAAKRVSSSTRATAGAFDEMARAARNADSVVNRINNMTGVTSKPFGDRATDIAAYGRELDKLRSKFSPLYAAQRQFDSITQEINRAQQVGAISADEASTALMREKAAYDTVTAAINRTTVAAKASVAARSAVGSHHTTNLMFQAQDIAMMTAMGQAPGMLAMQQGLQVGGIFSQMGKGANIVKGLTGALAMMLNPINLATIGFIGLGSAAVQALMNMGDDTDDATSALEQHSKWLDTILVGYQDARDAAAKVTDEALKLPQGSVESNLSAQRESAIASEIAAFDELIKKQVELQERLELLSLGGDLFTDIISASQPMADMALNIEMTNAQLGEYHAALTRIVNSKVDAETKKWAAGLLGFIDQARAARAETDSLGAALDGLPHNIDINIAVRGSGVTDAINRIKSLTPELRDTREIINDIFNESAGEARTTSEMQALADTTETAMAAIGEMERRTKALKDARSKSGSNPFDAWGSATESFQRRIDQMHLEIELYGKSTHEITKQQAAFDLLNQAKQAGVPITGTVTSQINAMAQEYADATVEMERMLEHTRSLEEARQATIALAQSVEQTLGGALSSLVDGPISDLDDALDRILGSFAGLGQQNLSKLFDGMLTPAANDNGQPVDLLSDISHAVEDGAKKGTLEGSMQGLASILGGNTGALSAGIGGLGVGYQTQDPLMGALGGAAQGFMAGGPMGAVIGGVAGLVGGLFGAAKATREAQEKLESLRGEVDKFTAAANGDVISKYASILDDATAKANDFIELANKAKDFETASMVQDALGKLPATLAMEFSKELDASLNALRGNDYLNDVAAAQELYNQRLKDAELLGVDASKAFDELKLSLSNIASESQLTQMQIDGLRLSSGLLGDALAGVFSSVDVANLQRGVDWAQANVDSARNDLILAYEEEENVLKSAADATQNYYDSLRRFRDDLMLDSNLSPLNPFERMHTAQTSFQDIAARAMNGDQEAIGKLEEISRDYLNEARDYYGTSEAYFSVFDQVKGILDQSLTGLEAQLSEDQRQLLELQTQSSLLTDLNGGVMSVASAIASLAEATSVLANAQSQYDQATGFSDEVTKLYQDILGRAPDPVGAAYWQDRINSGVTGQELIRNFMSGVTGADTITASAIAKYGLPGYATGTMFHPGGMAWVGEQGKELVNLPRGSQVMPHDVSMRMGAQNDNGQTALLTEVKALREEVKALRETTAAGANMVASAASGTTGAVQRQTEEQKRLAGARKA